MYSLPSARAFDSTWSTTALTSVIGSVKETPGMLRGCVLVAVSGVVTPITTTSSPSTPGVLSTIVDGWKRRTPSTYTLDVMIGKLICLLKRRNWSRPKSNSWLPTVMASKPTAFMTLAMSSPLELFEIGRPWNESPESKTRVVPFERESFTIPDKRASPITPLRSSSTIRP